MPSAAEFFVNNATKTGSITSTVVSVLECYAPFPKGVLENGGKGRGVG